MTVEERLRQDAARWSADEAAPPFDDLLEVATAGRRGRGTWLAVAAAVAATAVVAAAIVAQPWQRRQPGAGSATRAAHIDAIAVLAVQRSADPRRVSVWTRCTVTDPIARVVASGAAWVRITVSGEMTVDHSSAHSCHTPPTPVPVELPAPLGDRTVFAGDDVEQTPVLAADELPRPGYLPGGYEPDGVQPVAPGDDRLVGERDYRNGTDRIVVMVGATEQLPAHGLASQRAALTTVNGHSALITFESGTCVTWTIRASVDEAVCAIGNPGANLPTGEVVKIARSLP
jgi:hypothetical protein